jgi:hypothetical protein
MRAIDQGALTLVAVLQLSAWDSAFAQQDFLKPVPELGIRLPEIPALGKPTRPGGVGTDMEIPGGDVRPPPPHGTPTQPPAIDPRCAQLTEEQRRLNPACNQRNWQ